MLGCCTPSAELLAEETYPVASCASMGEVAEAADAVASCAATVEVAASHAPSCLLPDKMAANSPAMLEVQSSNASCCLLHASP